LSLSTLTVSDRHGSGITEAFLAWGSLLILSFWLPTGCGMRRKTPHFPDFPHWIERINRAAPISLRRRGSKGAAAASTGNS
jgi:hypothetical protein